MATPPYTFTDRKGGSWYVEYTAPSILALRPWHAQSADYPNPPLSRNEDDYPIRIALTEAALLEDLENFAARHTKIDPKPIGPPAPDGYIPPTPPGTDSGGTPVPKATPPNLGESTPGASADFPSPAARDNVIRALAPVVSSEAKSRGIVLTDAGRQVVLGIGFLESRFGQVPAFSYWVMRPEGPVYVPSYNFGAAMARSGVDTSFVKWVRNPASGKMEARKFASFSSPNAGVANFFRIWAKPEIVTQANQGDARGVASRMLQQKYFEPGNRSFADAAEIYAQAILGASGVVSNALGEPKKVTLGMPIAPSGGSSKVFVAGAALTALWWFFGR